MKTMNRNQAAVERLFRLVARLHAAGKDGLTTEQLVQAAELGEAKDPGTVLARDFRYLRDAGWQIENRAAPGESGHYVLRNMDVRMRVRLTPEQQAALRHAALVANRADLADRLGLETQVADLPESTVRASESAELQLVLAALQRRGLLRFRYNNAAREAHPASLRASAGHWYLDALETGVTQQKYFRVDRMSQIEAGPAGSADVVAPQAHSSFQPMHWSVDPPVEVTLRTRAEFVADVHRWLAAPVGQDEPDAENRVVLRYLVTNRRAFRSRVYELGTRVEVLGPDQVRAEIVEELESMGGHA